MGNERGTESNGRAGTHSAGARVLRISIEGEGVVAGKLPLRDFRQITDLAQRGIERTARVLMGAPGTAPGPLPEAVKEAIELLLVDIESGGVAIFQLDPSVDPSGGEPRLMPLPPRDLGVKALDRFVAGLHQLGASDDDHMPEGWDGSVLEVGRRLAETAAERSLKITFSTEVPATFERVARVSPDKLESFRTPSEIITRRRTVQGTLVAIDLEKGHLDLKRARGRRVQCHFGSDLLDRARRLVGETVLVSGEEAVDLAFDRPGRLEVEALRLSSQQALSAVDNSVRLMHLRGRYPR